jgi:hypothetical protein
MEKTPDPTGVVSQQDQSATMDTNSTRNNNDTMAVDIESSFAAWTCVFGGFLFLMPTFGTYSATLSKPSDQTYQA